MRALLFVATWERAVEWSSALGYSSSVGDAQRGIEAVSPPDGGRSRGFRTLVFPRCPARAGLDVRCFGQLTPYIECSRAKRQVRGFRST